MSRSTPRTDPFGSPLDRDPRSGCARSSGSGATVALTGELDDAAATTAAAAELMALDAAGDDAVVLHVDCSGGTLDAAFTRHRHHRPARCPGARPVRRSGRRRRRRDRRGGAPPRRDSPRALPARAAGGRVRRVGGERRGATPGSTSARWRASSTAWPRRPGAPFEHVEADLERGRWLDADEALAYGLIDEIERPEPAGTGARPTTLRIRLTSSGGETRTRNIRH